MIKTSKFPVTAPDGTRYLVKLKEEKDDFIIGRYICAKLYIPRKLIWNKKVFETYYWNGNDTYNYSSPDFILVAQKLVRDYYIDVEINNAVCKRIEEEESQRMSSLKKFTEWDGKIDSLE